MNYLDFEKPIQELEEELEKVKKTGEKTKADVSSLVLELEKKIAETRPCIGRQTQTSNTRKFRTVR